MAETDTTLPIGVELPVRLVIGEGAGAITSEIGTVTLDPGDTPDKLIAEFLYNLAKEINAQTQMALEMIDMGVMHRVEVPVGEVPGPQHLGGIVRGEPGEGVLDLSQVELPGFAEGELALILANAQDVQDGGRKACTPVPCPCNEGCEQGHELPVLTSYSCGGDGCACQPTT